MKDLHAAVSRWLRVEVSGVSGARVISARPRRRGVKNFVLALLSVTACASSPIEPSHDKPLRRCEYSNVGGRRMWEHVNVIANDGTFLTIEYPNREREIDGSRRGEMQQKKVLVDAGTIGPCRENPFTPTAPPDMSAGRQ